MPALGLATPLVRRYGAVALLWLLRRVGTDQLWQALQRQADGVAARQQAIRKARMTGGRFGAWIADGRTRYVVFKGNEPIDIFPALEEDLREALRHYDRSRLRRPDELRTAVARQRFADGIARLRRALRRGGSDDAGDVGAGELPAGRAAFDRVVAELDPLLERLTSAPAKPLEEHRHERPGVYLFSEGGTPLYVGQGRDHDALAHELARREAERSHVAVGEPEFAQLLNAARERVARMDVRFVEIEDPLPRHLLEPYAAEVLGTDWETR